MLPPLLYNKTPRAEPRKSISMCLGNAVTSYHILESKMYSRLNISEPLHIIGNPEITESLLVQDMSVADSLATLSWCSLLQR